MASCLPLDLYGNTTVSGTTLSPCCTTELSENRELSELEQFLTL